MEYLALAGVGLQILLLIFKEFFSAQARAREEDKKFQLDQATLKLIVDAAVEKWSAQNAKDSAGAGNAWDAVDGVKKSEAPKDQGPA